MAPKLWGSGGACGTGMLKGGSQRNDMDYGPEVQKLMWQKYRKRGQKELKPSSFGFGF